MLTDAGTSLRRVIADRMPSPRYVRKSRARADQFSKGFFDRRLSPFHYSSAIRDSQDLDEAISPLRQSSASCPFVCMRDSVGSISLGCVMARREEQHGFVRADSMTFDCLD